MFPKKYRITKTKDFEKVLNSPNIERSKFLTIKFLKNSLGYPRISVLAGVRSVSKKAVERNRIKRRVREAVKKNFHIIRCAGFDILVFCKKSAANATFEDLVSDVENLLRKIIACKK